MVFSLDHEKTLIDAMLHEPRGFFVEVGAGEPVKGSQSHRLELRGWSGLLIEPVPSLAMNLRLTRNSQVVEAACVAPGPPSELVLWMDDRSARKSSTRAVGPALKPRAITLNQVLADAQIKVVDFVSIDVEGMEADVLEGFNAAQYQPRLILVDDRAELGRCARIMRSQGYSLVRRTGHNAWFVPRHEDWTTAADRFALAWHYGAGRFARRLLRPR